MIDGILFPHRRPLRRHALVMNCYYNGLAIIRELGRRGVPVTAMDCERSVGSYSRYARYVRCPNPLTEEENFIEFLLGHGQRYKQRAILFPTNDHWAVALARAKHRLSERFIACVADVEVVESLLDKRRFTERAQRAGWPVPRSWTSADRNEIPPEAYPIVAKPICRRIASNSEQNRRESELFDRLRLTVLQTPEALRRFSEHHADVLAKLFFQEYVRGLSDSMYTVGVYVDAGHNVRGLFSGRKVRGFPPDSGDCIVGEVRGVPRTLKDLTQRICREIGYHGIAEFEFKRDAASGEYRLIEINPRSWSWIGITPSCGVSLPWIAYADLAGVERFDPLESNAPDGSVKWVRLLDDVQNCVYGNRRAGYPEWGMSVGGWFHSLRADRLVIAEFSSDDPTPGLYAAYAKLRALLALVCRKIVARIRSVMRSIGF